MQAEREVVRFLSAYQTIWHDNFPSLHRRAQWHIVTHLCTDGRRGAAVGELYGLVKQVFLLDDSTVKERILDIRELGLCQIDPPTGALSARTVIVPTNELLDLYDRHLIALARELATVATALDPTVRLPAPRSLDADQRALILHALACYRDPWRAALERIFDERDLSKARRVEAIRHLSSLSHWTLLHMALERRYGVSPFGGDDSAVLADQMAAALLNQTGQNFQTTRDHIAYLMTLGLLERQSGKSLRVALSDSAAAQLHQALGAAAASLPDVARKLADTLPAEDEVDAEATLNLRAGVALRQELGARHYIVIKEPRAARRRIALTGSLTIGRVPPSGLLLESAEISRAHCRIDVQGDQVSVTDLNSTNGTFVGGRRIDSTVELPHGAVLQVGSYVLTCEHQSDIDAGTADSTQRSDGIALLRDRRSRTSA